MIDIYPIQKKQKTKKQRIFSSILLKYSIGTVILVLAVYFSLGYINQAIDSWLKLEPIKTESETKNLVNKKPITTETNLPESLGAQTEIESKIETKLESNQSTANDAETKPQAKPQEIDKGAIKIKVLNGNAIWGAAAKAKELLESNGFKVASIGNNDQQNFPTTVIYHKPEKSAEADLVKQTIQNDYSVFSEANSDLTKDSDLVIVVGRK